MSTTEIYQNNTLTTGPDRTGDMTTTDSGEIDPTITTDTESSTEVDDQDVNMSQISSSKEPTSPEGSNNETEHGITETAIPMYTSSGSGLIPGDDSSTTQPVTGYDSNTTGVITKDDTTTTELTNNITTGPDLPPLN